MKCIAEVFPELRPSHWNGAAHQSVARRLQGIRVADLHPPSLVRASWERWMRTSRCAVRGTERA